MAVSLLLEYLTRANVAGVFVITVIATLAINAFSGPSYPPQFAWVGEGQGLLAWFKGNITYITQYADWVQDGYKKVFAPHQIFRCCDIY
jgi:hypothetical protein